MENLKKQTTEAGESAKKTGEEFDSMADKIKKSSVPQSSVPKPASPNVPDTELPSKTSIADASDLVMMAAGYKAVSWMKSGFTAAAEAAVGFESAMTDVYKTVDGTSEQLDRLGKAAIRMSSEVPSSAEEIAGVMASAGQLGIATENVESFSKVMIDLANSTNLTSEAAASELAKFANVTNLDPSKYENLGSVIVDLGNNFATTESDIVSMASYFSSAASLAGFAQSDILGLSAAVSSMGITAEAGGSSMARLITMMQTAVETGDGLEQFASVADMSVQQFADSFERDGVRALQAFISGLNDVERNGATAAVILQEMGINDVRLSNTIKALASGESVLADAVSTSSAAWAENTALANEANKRYATLDSKIQMTKNSFHNLGTSVGTTFLPVVDGVNDAVNNAVNNYSIVQGDVYDNSKTVELLAEIAGNTSADRSVEPPVNIAVDLSLLDSILSKYKSDFGAAYYHEDVYNNSEVSLPMPVRTLDSEPSERVSRMEIAITVEGRGTVSAGVQSGISKEELIELLNENICPVLVTKIADEAMGEGDSSYDT